MPHPAWRSTFAARPGVALGKKMKEYGLR